MNLYADEDFNFSVVKQLRLLGYDVLTVQEDGMHAASDSAVLTRAHLLGRVVLTHNRRHFERMDKQGMLHSGIFRLYKLRANTLSLRIVSTPLCRQSRLAAGAFASTGLKEACYVMSAISQILSEADFGCHEAIERLLPLVYDELRQMAQVHIANERPGQTLQATALVHEAYLRLVGDQHFENRHHFFAAAAQAMRRILVDNARRKRRQKRGGGSQREEISALNLAAPQPSDDLIALDEALELLMASDPMTAKLVQLRYFAGLSVPEAAEALGISPRSADRLWAYARAWLHEKIHGESLA